MEGEAVLKETISLSPLHPKSDLQILLYLMLDDFTRQSETLIRSFFETPFKIKTSDKIWRRFNLSKIIFKSKKSKLNFAYKK